MAKKTNTKDKTLPLESVLWNCRVALRGVGTVEKNRDALIALVFLKFAGDKFEKRRDEIVDKYGDNPIYVEKPSFYKSKNIWYLDEKSRWSYISKNSAKPDIAVIIDQAMENIENENEQLKGALPLNAFSNLGASNTKIKDLIDNVNLIDEKKYTEIDLIGRVYEYFLQSYAAAGKKEDGEFYTPASVVELIAELIEPYDGTVYDPCCGTGGMFVQSMKFVDKHKGDRRNVTILGQESQEETWRLCKMNLSIRGISHDLGSTNKSTFEEDLHKTFKVDYIMANPPFNLKGWRNEGELTKDPRFYTKAGFSVMPPVSNANYAWICHMLSKLDPSHGVAGFLLANGALNADGDEGILRKEIIQKDRVEAIIVLPRDMFYTTDISVTLWILNMNKNKQDFHGEKLRDRRHEVLFMDLRTWDQNINEIKIDKGSKKKTAFSEEQINEVKRIFKNWQTGIGYEDVPELCKSVKTENKYLTEDEKNKEVITIESKGYSLAPSKYIEFIDHDLDIDYKKEMKRIQKEMKEILKQEEESQEMLKKAFEGIGYGIK